MPTRVSIESCLHEEKSEVVQLGVLFRNKNYQMQLQGEVTYSEFCEIIQKLSQVGTYQIRHRDNRQEVVGT